MSKYYYLTASLPHLRFDETPPVSREDFLEECRKWLSPGDFSAVEGLRLGETHVAPADHAAVSDWKAFDLGLRAFIAGMRKANHHAAQQKDRHLLKDRVENKNPLEREKIIEKIRWEYIEGEEYKYMFDLGRLALYCVKIEILERLASFNMEKGRERFEKICEVKNGERKR